MINFLALNICPIYCACSISVSNAKNSRNILLISVKFPSNTWRYVRMNFSLNIFPHHVALYPDTYFTRIIRFIFLGIGYSVFFCWFLRDPSIIKIVFISHMVLFKTHYLLMLFHHGVQMSDLLWLKTKLHSNMVHDVYLLERKLLFHYYSR